METRKSTLDIWGTRTPHHGEWPARVDARTVDTPERWVQSACVLCSNGCGIDIGVKDGRIVGVRGRAEDRVNRGRLGPKGLHCSDCVSAADRLTRPMVRKGGKLVATTWDDAMGRIVKRAKQLLSSEGPGSIGFYTSGQLFLEEYYTLGVVGKAGLGTPHMDGNTRLCTATAAAALKESFGCDGQPGTFSDVDVTDAMLLVGHNMAETQTVLWSRVLDRRRGPTPPKLVVIDPRLTPSAREADVHLAPRVGTNVALLNGLLHLVIRHGELDQAFMAAHTVGFEELRRVVEEYPPERVAGITGVAQAELERAAALLGRSKSLVSTVLQGVYQSMQATAAAVQVNNLHLIRGMIGKPGCGVMQMNGQPTAQNTRETGADGDLPGFRNWANPEHIKELARIWNVEPSIIPHWAPPTHAMQIFRYAEEGSIKLLWISATNPAVSLPELGRIRKILAASNVMVVVQDCFMTETAELADVVLPAAMWGEKTGTFTNADRTVHLSLKAVEPPGEAKSDFEIFVDFARRMELKDKDGAPLIKWSTPEEAFEGWKECSRGRPCDYSGMSYAMLTGGSGVQWPCNAAHPRGGERLYTDGRFPTSTTTCETFGHDLETGAVRSEDEYKAIDPRGKAFIRPAHFHPPHEAPDSQHPFMMTTGRVVHHFHTRTKTGRAPELQAAAPDAFVQLNEEDAKKLKISEGDLVEVKSRRGFAYAPARLGGIARGLVFMPFHYGYWDDDGRARAANELTLTEWDPVSKQPHFKYAAVALKKVKHARSAGGVKGDVGKGVKRRVQKAQKMLKKTRPHVADYLGILRTGEQSFVKALENMVARHGTEPDVEAMCGRFAQWSGEHETWLKPFTRRYGSYPESEPVKLRKELHPRHTGPFGLVRDLHGLWMLRCEARMTTDILLQAAHGMRDMELVEILEKIEERNTRVLHWLETRVKQAAPQSLVQPS